MEKGVKDSIEIHAGLETAPSFGDFGVQAWSATLPVYRPAWRFDYDSVCPQISEGCLLWELRPSMEFEGP